MISRVRLAWRDCEPSRRSLPGRWAALAGLLFLVCSCANPDPNVAAAFDGYRLALPQIREEYLRVNGDGSWERSSAEERADFARLLLDKQILLMLAQEACPEPDSKRDRLDRVLREKTLQKMFQAWRRDRFSLDPGVEEAQLQLLVRQAGIRRCLIAGRQAQAVKQSLAAGAAFDEIVDEYGLGAEGAPRVWEDTVAVGRSPNDLLESVLLADPPVGSALGPMFLPEGPIVLQVLSFTVPDRPVSDGDLTTARETLRDLQYGPAQRAYFDSLRGAAGVQIHEESMASLQEKFAAYWDSLGNVVGLDFQTLRAPRWKFGPSEKALPVFDLHGRTYSLGEFVESLDEIDLDYWPTVGTRERVRAQVEQRVIRLLLESQAEREGFAESRDFLAAVSRMKERHHLEQFRDRYLREQVAIPEERLRQEFQRRPEAYRAAERVAFASLTFPETEADRARSIRNRLEENGELWPAVAAAEIARGSGVSFVADSGPLSIREAPAQPSWTLFRNLAASLQPGQYSEVVQTRDGFAIVRCNERQPARPSTFEEAIPALERVLRPVVLDEEIERRLEVARARLHPAVYPERLIDDPDTVL